MATAHPQRLGRKSHRRLKELLLDAREGGNESIQWTIRDHKIPVDAENAAGLNALYYAVRGRRYKITKYLIKLGADVNPPLPRQPSLLDIARELGDTKLVRILSDAGAYPKPAEQLDEERRTLPRWPRMIDFKTTEYPLYAAAISGDQATFADLAGKMPQKRLQALLTETCIEHEVEFGLALIPVCRTSTLTARMS